MYLTLNGQKNVLLILMTLNLAWSWPTTITTTQQIESSTSVRDRNCGIENADQIVDNLIPGVQRKISEHRVYLSFRTGVLNLGPGQLIGLKTVNRSGHADVICNATHVVLSVPLATNKAIRAKYDWDKIVNGVTEKGVAHARASSFQGRVTLGRMTNETNASLRVIDVIMAPSEDVEVNVGGLSHISWLWSRAIKFVTTSMLKAMCSAANDAVRDAFSDVLALSDT